MAGLDDADAYTGPARLRIGGREFDVRAELRGHFEPIDGRYHWYGRIARDDEVAAVVGQGRASAALTTTDGSAPCELSDPDPWRRYRVTGISTPPFRTGMAMHATVLPAEQHQLPREAGDD
jgi:hypothetical protein